MVIDDKTLSGPRSGFSNSLSFQTINNIMKEFILCSIYIVPSEYQRNYVVISHTGKFSQIMFFITIKFVYNFYKQIMVLNKFITSLYLVANDDDS